MISVYYISYDINKVVNEGIIWIMITDPVKDLYIIQDTKEYVI